MPAEPGNIGPAGRPSTGTTTAASPRGQWTNAPHHGRRHPSRVVARRDLLDVVLQCDCWGSADWLTIMQASCIGGWELPFEPWKLRSRSLASGLVLTAWYIGARPACRHARDREGRQLGTGFWVAGMDLSFAHWRWRCCRTDVYGCGPPAILLSLHTADAMGTSVSDPPNAGKNIIYTRGPVHRIATIVHPSTGSRAPETNQIASGHFRSAASPLFLTADGRKRLQVARRLPPFFGRRGLHDWGEGRGIWVPRYCGAAFRFQYTERRDCTYNTTERFHRAVPSGSPLLPVVSSPTSTANMTTSTLIYFLALGLPAAGAFSSGFAGSGFFFSSGAAA